MCHPKDSLHGRAGICTQSLNSVQYIPLPEDRGEEQRSNWTEWGSYPASRETPMCCVISGKFVHLIVLICVVGRAKRCPVQLG